MVLLNVEQTGDFLADSQRSRTVNVAPGATAPYNVQLTNDGQDEPDGEITVTIQPIKTEGPKYSIDAQNKVVITVTDDDPFPTMSINDPVAVNEGNVPGDNATLTFLVTLSARSANTFTVDYVVGKSGDTATSGTDYEAKSGTLTFERDVTTQLIEVQIIEDTVLEDDETITVVLSNQTPSGVSITKSEGSSRFQ